MTRGYKPLLKQEFTDGIYKLVPIRDEDKYTIMQWRNEQIDILRQTEPLTKEKQAFYFRNIVDRLFEEEKPAQLLFSFLEKDRLIGYGGLVHIDWESKNGEISFIVDTNRNNNKKIFSKDFESFLDLIIKIAIDYLGFFKIHTTLYDIESRLLYKETIKNKGFVTEGKLTGHHMINGKLRDTIIFSYFKK